MNNTVSLGGAALVQFQSQGSPLAGASGGSFASRLTSSVPATAGPGISGTQVVGAATDNQPSALGSLASNAAGSNSEYLTLVDSARQFAMQNAIFAAGNAPVVEKDNG